MKQGVMTFVAILVPVSVLGDGREAVENEMSDLRNQVMPRGQVAVATYILDAATPASSGDVSMAQACETDAWQKIDDE